jgi:hypothetical protein
MSRGHPYNYGMERTDDDKVTAVIGMFTALGGAAVYIIDDSMMLRVPAIALVGIGLVVMVLALVARAHA